MSTTEVATYYAKSREDWRNWLLTHHRTQPAVWLFFYKKASPHPSLSWSEAVDEALCFGWIDSKKQSIDADSYRQFYCKRKAHSTWSKINKEKITQLTNEGQMMPAGLDAVQTARKNGSWTTLDTAEALVIPNDLEKALFARAGAKAFFMNQSATNRKRMLHWIAMAKRDETRKTRVDRVVAAVAKGTLPKQ
jgi:uncharacterized protein YdeI (YjbR/CyaY-like superfamily)